MATPVGVSSPSLGRMMRPSRRLADDQRPAVGRQVVEQADELVLEVGALLLETITS
jgi:hypothetical protein